MQIITSEDVKEASTRPRPRGAVMLALDMGTG